MSQGGRLHLISHTQELEPGLSNTPPPAMISITNTTRDITAIITKQSLSSLSSVNILYVCFYIVISY